MAEWLLNNSGRNIPKSEGLSLPSKETEVALRVAARLAAIVESSEDAIISKDLQGTIETWNAAGERIYGYPAEEVIGRQMTILLPEDRSNEEADILARIRRGERVQHFETKRVRKDGSVIEVSLTISPVRNPDGEVIGASHIARDITRQKSFELQVRQAQRLDSLGMMAGAIAHDFNNLLVGVIANASLLSEMVPDDSPMSSVISDLSATGQRLRELTRQLLRYAGMETAVTGQPVDLAELVREIAKLIRAAIPRNVDVQLELDESMPAIKGDPTQIQQVAVNLILNAAEAADKPKAWVKAKAYGQNLVEADLRSVLASENVTPGAYVCLSVEDNGRGMDAPTQSKIFDPFFTTKVAGRGLGMASVLGIVRAHKGAMSVESEPGRGTTVHVFFPVAQQVIETEP